MRCPKCNGKGFTPSPIGPFVPGLPTPMWKCRNCNGTGLVTPVPELAGSPTLITSKNRCPVCKGEGKVPSSPHSLDLPSQVLRPVTCRNCNGTGEIRPPTVSLRILDTLNNEFMRLEFPGRFFSEVEYQNCIAFPDLQARGFIQCNEFAGDRVYFHADFDLSRLDLIPLAVAVLQNRATPLKLAAQINAGFVLNHVQDNRPVPPGPLYSYQGNRRAPKDCAAKIALIVEGDTGGVSFTSGSLDAAEKDMQRDGYQVKRLTRPTKGELLEAMADSCVKALIMIGHGSSNNPSFYLREDSDIIPADVRNIIGNPPVPFDLVIMHACYQGAQNHRAAWMRAFGMPPGVFYSWDWLAFGVGVTVFQTAY